VPDGFPWLSARVSYNQRTSVQARGSPGFAIASEDQLVLVRTLSGRHPDQIRAVDFDRRDVS
jgi:hypothetical protein